MATTTAQVRRWAALAAAYILITGGLSIAEAVGAPPASAVTGLTVVTAISSIDSTSPKTAIAYCPAGTRVIGGGGGLIWQGATHVHEVVLTQLQPVHPISGQDSYIVSAAENSIGTTQNWWIEAEAICADEIPGMHIAFAVSTLSSASLQSAEAVCAAGEKVLGTGGWVYPSGGQVGIQVARASINGDKSYLRAHEDADGYTGNWNVIAFAVCAPAPAGYEIVTGQSSAADSETEKQAEALCPVGKRVHGSGGGTAFNAPGAVSLSRINVNTDGNDRKSSATASENTATSSDWDFIVAYAICAT